MRPDVDQLGDSALVVRLGSSIDEPTRVCVQNAAARLVAASLAGVRDVVSGFTTVTVHYDLGQIAHDALIANIESALSTVDDTPEADDRLVRIPVCYGGAYGPDVDEVAGHAGMSAASVAELHAAREYRVHMLGFLPGFGYLGGLDPRIAAPRRATPRDRVQAGAVGIAGEQTGVYPLESPGGWQLIGRTPLAMFDPFADPPTRLRAGDRVTFESIDAEAFDALVRESARAPVHVASAQSTVSVVRPGMFTTVQDGGRWGWQSLGVGPGGVMDLDAMRIANALVGNDEDAAVLESTLIGPVLRVEHDALVALTGASSDARVNGEPIPSMRAVFVPAGFEISVGNCSRGCRTTLAIAGGIDVVPMLGSRSTNVRAHFGGFEGRAIRAGDQLPVGPLSEGARRLIATLRGTGAWAAEPNELDVNVPTSAADGVTLRLIAAAEFSRLDLESRDTLFESPFTVDTRSDRMGYRLTGPVLDLVRRTEMISEGVTWGAVQLPPDGHPIVLAADRPTTGGYPIVGHVASVDRSLLAQLKPGDRIRFARIELRDAREEWLARRRHLTAAIDALRRGRAEGDAR